MRHEELLSDQQCRHVGQIRTFLANAATGKLPLLTRQMHIFGASSPSLPCAAKTCALSVGDRPTRQLPLQPVAIGVVVEVTKRSEPSV